MVRTNKQARGLLNSGRRCTAVIPVARKLQLSAQGSSAASTSSIALAAPRQVVEGNWAPRVISFSSSFDVDIRKLYGAVSCRKPADIMETIDNADSDDWDDSATSDATAALIYGDSGKPS